MGKVRPKTNLSEALWKDESVTCNSKAMRKADAKLRKLVERSEPGKCYTLHEIAEAMGITRERVRQIEARALRKLNKRLGQVFKSENITPEEAVDMVGKISKESTEHQVMGKEDTNES